MYRKLTFTFCVLLFVSSCLPQGQGTNRRKRSSQIEGEPTPTATPVPSTFNNDKDPIYWFSNDTVLKSTLLISKDNKSVARLRGTKVEEFLAANSLANAQKVYCLVASYSSGESLKQFRTRVFPYMLEDLRVDPITFEWAMRVDIGDTEANQTYCPGTIDSVVQTDAAFDLISLCPNCNDQLASTKIALYQTDAITVGPVVDTTQLDLSTFSIQIDYNTVVEDPGGCSEAICRARNYDCCIQSQCVINGTEKTNASSDPDYNQTVIELALDYQRIVDYKHIYNVCGNLPLPTRVPTPTPDPQEQAKLELENMTKIYNCLQDSTLCIANGYNTQADATTELYKVCGCKATSNPEINCGTGWSLTPISDSNGTLRRYECYYPPPLSTGPDQFDPVQVSSKNIPHLFYQNSDGAVVDDIFTLFSAASTEVNEGTQFSYFDATNNAIPTNDEFNMNAILGQMLVDLTGTRPAKMVNVKQSTNYILRATIGTFRPCENCSSVAWNDFLSAWPQTSNGYGVRATGYTTDRLGLDFSYLSFANYEDRQFGRSCWVPATMLPFSHYKDANVITQRKNRLTTQAALYVNGYMRDWFGFNYGALIGSFDGVKWFAIGHGRKVNSGTSKKLYLAINAPLLDLAATTDTTVHVTEVPPAGLDTPITDNDWDFSADTYDPIQNQGATCQQYHQCTYDSDCVTQLGWEYMCADVSVYRTLWPTFAVNEETANMGNSINGNAIPFKGSITGNSKRCVYRGRGAVCKKNYLSLSQNMRKHFTCAPNFYCADVDSSVFNDTLVREDAITSILFGQEADFIGRPKTYLTDTKALPAEAVINLKANSDANHASFATDNDLGLCLPGKLITNTSFPIAQHQAQDPSDRADYISQISTCDYALTDTLSTFNRTQGCPVFDINGDYTYPITGEHSLIQTRVQNVCGSESISSVTGDSTFSNLLKGTLTSAGFSLDIKEQLAIDACYRRAGSVCHTDLDCAPNILHSRAAEGFIEDDFGGSNPEKAFWEEYLICGQAETNPRNTTDSNFKTYAMTKNKCCRELEKTITISTAGDPSNATYNGTLGSSFDQNKQSVIDPSVSGRYSRFTSIASLADTSPDPTPYYELPLVQVSPISTATEPKKFQWKTIGKAAEDTCCGGGFVRAFATSDNSNHDNGIDHDWKNVTRLQIGYTDFQCLNYLNEVIEEKPNETLQLVWQNEEERFCTDPNASPALCWQQPFNSTTTFQIVPPSDPNVSGTLSFDTLPAYTYSAFVPYQQSVPPPPPNGDCAAVIGGGPPTDARGTGQLSANLFAGLELTCMYLPSYVNGQGNIDLTTIEFLEDNNFDGLADATQVANVAPFPATAGAGNLFWAYSNGIFAWGTTTGGGLASDYYIRFSFYPSNTDDWREDGTNAASNLDPDSSDNRRALNPGNDLYYLERLGRLELLGIPQIIYEPLYCNTNGNKLVPGIFLSTATDRDAFSDANFSFQVPRLALTSDAANPVSYDSDPDPAVTTLANNGPRATTNQFVAISDVFSSDQFYCCHKLGDVTDSTSKCCSNHSEKRDADGDGDLEDVCVLPEGANLNVYFNRFITNEGIGSSYPGGGFNDLDFDPYTGEIKLQQTSYTKLQEIGEKYCEFENVITGGAFGAFTSSPKDTTTGTTAEIYGILDENADFQAVSTTTPTPVPNNERGFAAFRSGFKWNHHFYCGPQTTN